MNQTPTPSNLIGEDAVETRIVAWVLGESSARESTELERLCETRPDLSAFRLRISELHQSLIQMESTTGAPTWTLPPEKRRALEECFCESSRLRLDTKTTKTPRFARFQTFCAIAACLLLTAIVVRITRSVSVSRSIPLASQYPMDLMPVTDPNPTDGAAKIATSSPSRTDEIYGVTSRILAKSRDSGLQETARQRQLAVKKVPDSSGEIIAAIPSVLPDLEALTSDFATEPASDVASVGALSGPRMNVGSDLAVAWSHPLVSSSPAEFKGQGLNSAVAVNSARRSKFRIAADADAESADRVGSAPPLAATASEPAMPSLKTILTSEDRCFTFPFTNREASFQRVKAAFTHGTPSDPNTIQLEQFYNAIDYGDPAPATGESIATTIEQSAHPFIPNTHLVRVALRTGSSGRNLSEPLRLTLLFDQSGSASLGSHRSSMARALTELAGLLTKNDLISAVGGSQKPRLLVDGMTGDQAGKLVDLLGPLTHEGKMNLEDTLKLAGEIASRQHLAGAQNRVILFADRAMNLDEGQQDRLGQQVRTLRQQGLFFDVAGTYPSAFTDGSLSKLASVGDGRCYLVSEENAPHFASQLAGAYHLQAENVMVAVKFNPQRVGKHSLLGFEQDTLVPEHFAGGVANATKAIQNESGVAIYQLELLPKGAGEIGEVSVSFKDAVSKEIFERISVISYPTRPTALAHVAPSMQLAGLTLLAAEKLRGDPSADHVDIYRQATSLSRVKQFYANSPQIGEMLQLIEKLK